MVDLAAAVITLLVVAWLLWASRKGLDLADEGFYLLTARHPEDVVMMPTSFHHVTSWLLRATGGSIVAMRIVWRARHRGRRRRPRRRRACRLWRETLVARGLGGDDERAARVQLAPSDAVLQHLQRLGGGRRDGLRAARARCDAPGAVRPDAVARVDVRHRALPGALGVREVSDRGGHGRARDDRDRRLAGARAAGTRDSARPGWSRAPPARRRSCSSPSCRRTTGGAR